MNYAETFQDFSSKLSSTDLLLYAGAGLIIYVLFKNKLDPIKNSIIKLFNNVTDKTSQVLPLSVTPKSNDDVFFELITSWKKTRDLAIKSGCDDAIKVADQMFPFLSPSGCAKNEVTS